MVNWSSREIVDVQRTRRARARRGRGACAAWWSSEEMDDRTVLFKGGTFNHSPWTNLPACA